MMGNIWVVAVASLLEGSALGSIYYYTDVLFRDPIPTRNEVWIRRATPTSDIGRSVWGGYTLCTGESTSLRMVSEEVDIHWGKTCRVAAKFTLQNDAAEPEELTVGFPDFPLITRRPELYGFRVSVGNSDFRLPQRRPIYLEDSWVPFSESDPYLGWSVWHQTFPPGRTVIRAEYCTEVATERAKDAWSRTLYVSRCGLCWRGPVERMEVTVHFDEPVTEEQVARSSPPGFHVDGRTMSWRFTNFVPRWQDDICVACLPFPAYHKLQELRQKVHENPEDEKSAVELARHCFSLESENGYPSYDSPRVLPAAERDAILAAIQDPNDKAVFEKYWATESEVWRYDAQLREYTALPAFLPPFRNHLWRADAVDLPIIHIMASVGYLPYPIAPYDAQAEELLERLLEKDPGNADAWFAYLSNCNHFLFGTCMPGRTPGWCSMDREQKRIIERAYTHCPGDERIKVWHDFALSEAADATDFPGREMTAFLDRLRKAELPIPDSP
jgi:hypothetical protein